METGKQNRSGSKDTSTHLARPGELNWFSSNMSNHHRRNIPSQGQKASVQAGTGRLPVWLRSQWLSYTAATQSENPPKWVRIVGKNTFCGRSERVPCQNGKGAAKEATRADRNTLPLIINHIHKYPSSTAHFHDESKAEEAAPTTESTQFLLDQFLDKQVVATQDIDALLISDILIRTN